MQGIGEDAATRRAPRWNADEIDLSAVDPAIADDEDWFFRIAVASFVESASDLYTRNLVTYFAAEPRIAGWLEATWMHEELQHGRALRRYLERVWPAFDWPGAYARFLDEYAPLSSPERYRPTPALELAARCAVETGTSAYYRMLRDLAPEPRLREILGRIAADEVVHYKHFLHYLRQLRHGGGGRDGTDRTEGPDLARRDPCSRAQVFRAIVGRLQETHSEDGWIAFRHAYGARHPRAAADVAAVRHEYRRFVAATRRAARAAFPHRMVAGMIVAPLDLPAAAHPRAQRAVEAVIRGIARLQ